VDLGKQQFGVTLKISECGLGADDVMYFRTFMDEARLLQSYALSKVWVRCASSQCPHTFCI
jgi:hypothetical protein